MVCSKNNFRLENGSQKVLFALELLTVMSSIVISEALLKDLDDFNDEDDEEQFQELRLMYLSNSSGLKEFA